MVFAYGRCIRFCFFFAGAATRLVAREGLLRFSGVIVTWALVLFRVTSGGADTTEDDVISTGNTAEGVDSKGKESEDTISTDKEEEEIVSGGAKPDETDSGGTVSGDVMVVL